METRPAPRSRREEPADRSRSGLRRPPSGVTLWRPEIVLASSLKRLERPRTVAVAEPLHRPDSVKARIEAASAVLSRLDEARHALNVRAAAADARTQEAQSDRDRVSAAIDRYRAEAALDEWLSVTSTQVSALMKERGLR